MTDEELEKASQEYLYDRLDPKAIDSVSEFADTHIEDAITSSFKAGYKECKVEASEIITALLNVFVYDLADDELDSGDIDVRDKAERFLGGH